MTTAVNNRNLFSNHYGHHFAPQAKVEQGAKRPDYAFFENELILNEALDKKVKGAMGHPHKLSSLRIYHKETSYKLDSYYEINLCQWCMMYPDKVKIWVGRFLL